jgi:PEP-CTERM motif
MKKLWIVSAAVVALSGSMFADTLTGTGTLTAFPAGFAGSTPVWISNGTPPLTTGAPFWNDASDDTGLGAGQGSSHLMNVGYVLTGTGGMTGVASVTGGDAVSTDYLGTAGADPTAFSFIRQATSYNISLIFAQSGLNTGANPAGAVGNQFGYYVGATSTMLYNVGQVPPGPTSTQAFNPSGNYGFYDTVCYHVTAGVCDSFETYTTSNGNTGNAQVGLTTWNHFALFQLASGNYVIGFTGQNGMFGEGQGDFQDTLVELSLAAVPEPGTIAIMGFGLAGLGLLGRRRFLKK